MLAFIRYDKGKVLYSRLRNTMGHYYNFIDNIWIAVEDVTCRKQLTEYPDSDLLESTYMNEFTLPLYQGNLVHEVVYLSDGSVVGIEDILPTHTEDILNQFTFDGSGNVQAVIQGSIVIPNMDGAIYSPTIVYGETIKVVKGDTPTLSFDLKNDYTGYSLILHLVNSADPLDYKTVNGSWIDITLGTGTVDLTGTETSVLGVYEAELKVTNGAKIYTPLKFYVHIIRGMP